MKKKIINVDNIILQITDDPSMLNKLTLEELRSITKKLNLDTEILDKRKKSEYIETLWEYLESLDDENGSDETEEEDLFDEEVADEDEMNIRPVRTWADLALKIADRGIVIGLAILDVMLSCKLAGSRKKVNKQSTFYS